MAYFRLTSGCREVQSCVCADGRRNITSGEGSDESLAGRQHPEPAWTVCSERESRRRWVGNNTQPPCNKQERDSAQVRRSRSVGREGKTFREGCLSEKPYTLAGSAMWTSGSGNVSVSATSLTSNCSYFKSLTHFRHR